jgi:hypothetical protein
MRDFGGRRRRRRIRVDRAAGQQGMSVTVRLK